MSAESDVFENAARARLAEKKTPQSFFGFGNDDLTVNDSYADDFTDDLGHEKEQLHSTIIESAEPNGDAVGTSDLLDHESDVEEVFESLSELAVKDSVALFIASLQEPRHQTQPTGLEIAEMFQEFYLTIGNSNPLDDIADENQASELLSPLELIKQKKKVLRYNEQLTAAQEQAEAILTTQLYSKICQTLIDVEYEQELQIICDKCNALLCHNDLLDLLQFNVQKHLRADLIAIADSFKGLDDIYEPRAKVAALVDLQQRIVKVLESASDSDAEKQHKVSLDALLPALIFTTIHADVRALARDLIFVRRYRRRDSWDGHESYSVTNFEAVLCALKAASLKTTEGLPGGVDPGLFAPNSGCGDNSQAMDSLMVPLETRARSTSQSSLTPSANSLQSRFENFGSSFSNGYRSFITKLSRERGPNDLEIPKRSMSAANIGYSKQNAEQDIGEASTFETPLDKPSNQNEEASPKGNIPLLYVEQRFLTADADLLTIGDVRELLKQYQYLGNAVMRIA